MNKLNPYSIIEGKYPQFTELRDWSEDRWLSYIGFLDFFIKSYENSEKWHMTSDNIKEMEQYLTINNHPWQEFIWRTGQWKDKTTPKKYMFKVNGMAMHTLGYLKKHPSLVTDKIKEAIEHHPQRLGWCLKQFKVVETLGGEEIVRRDVVVDQISTTKQTSLPSLQAKMMTSIVKVADIVEMLASGISAKDIKGMEVKDRLSQLAKLMPILTTLGKAKLNTNHFTQINLNGSTKDVESQMLQFIKVKDEN